MESKTPTASDIDIGITVSRSTAETRFRDGKTLRTQKGQPHHPIKDRLNPKLVTGSRVSRSINSARNTTARRYDAKTPIRVRETLLMRHPQTS
ncbi:MAG: hypothetical protein QXP10_01990 [Sulfolobales archaeon]